MILLYPLTSNFTFIVTKEGNYKYLRIRSWQYCQLCVFVKTWFVLFNSIHIRRDNVHHIANPVNIHGKVPAASIIARTPSPPPVDFLEEPYIPASQTNFSVYLTHDKPFHVSVFYAGGGYRPQGKVMFSQVSVCPHSASWLLDQLLDLVTARSLRILLEWFLVGFFSYFENCYHIVCCNQLKLSIS